MSLFLYLTFFWKGSLMANPKSALVRELLRMLENNPGSEEVLDFVIKTQEKIENMDEQSLQELARDLCGKRRPSFVLTTGTRR